MVLENFSVGLVLVRVSLLLLSFSGVDGLGPQDVVAYFCAPLLNGVETEQSWIAAALDLAGVDGQIVLQDVQLVVAQGLLLLSENQPFPHFQTAVLPELFYGLFKSVSLCLFVLC